MITSVTSHYYDILNISFTIPDDATLFFKKFSATPMDDETIDSARRRQLFHIGKVALGVLALGAVASMSFYTLPPLLALSLTIMALSLLTRTYNNPYWIQEKLTDLKNQIQTAFVQKPSESRVQFAYRLSRNLFITLFAVAFMTVCLLALPYLASGTLFIHSGSWISLNPQFLMQISSPLIIYASHFAMGIAALYKSIDAFNQNKLLEMLFYLLLAPLAFIAPFEFAAMGELRWHHLSYGLLLALAPFRGLQIFGALMALDGALYFINPCRGYDFSNFFVDHLSTILSLFILSITAELSLSVKQNNTAQNNQKNPYPTNYT